ncbi:MAG: ABC transporter permease [Burkholderiales bacterium]|nr:ABC transporter permease [Burkholderiales bacterium]
MDLLATLRIALRALRVNKLRSSLTMLGIIIGVGAVITMIAVGGGAQARVEEQIKSLGSNLMIVIPGSTTSGGVRMGSSSAQTLTEDDAAAITREVDEVQVAAPVTRGSGQIVAGNSNWSTVIYGTTPDYLEARDWPVVSGRGFEPQEVSGAGKVAIIGQSVSKQLFGDADPVDQQVRIRKVPFTIVGMLDKKGQSMMGTDQDDVILVPLATARNRLFGNPQGKLRRIHFMSIKVRDGHSMKDAENRIRELMRQRHKLQAGADDDFTIRNLTEILQAQEASSKVLSLLLAAVASVSLLVGGIGIMNIMLVSVTERTREIGLRMAVGARANDILKQFLVEAVTLSLIGGMLGIALGLGGSLAIGQFAGWRTSLSGASVVLAVGFAAAIGIFFGFYPARKASRLLPIEALRYE